MKKIVWGLAFFLALFLSFWAGHRMAAWQARMAVVCGPYSDDYGPALEALDTAKAKLARGEVNVIQELDQAALHVKNARTWAEKFIGHSAAASDAASR